MIIDVTTNHLYIAAGAILVVLIIMFFVKSVEWKINLGVLLISALIVAVPILVPGLYSCTTLPNQTQ